MRNSLESTQTQTEIITTTNGVSFDIGRIDNFSIQVVADVNTPAALAFATSDVNTTDDEITEVAHGFTTGLKGQTSTTTTLPAGLSTSTDYFVIVIDVDTYQLATSLANSLAGTQIDITDQGTGTHTFTPTSVAGATVTLQKSNDDSNWTNQASATSITTDGSYWFEVVDATYRYIRVIYAITAGRMTVDAKILSKD